MKPKSHERIMGGCKYIICANCGEETQIERPYKTTVDYCGACGKIILDVEHSFCGWCGEKIDWEAQG